MKRVIKISLLKMFEIMGCNAILRKLNGSPIVLFWHGISEKCDDVIEAESNVLKSTFEKQIKYLKKKYEIISLQEFYNRYVSHSFTNREAVITFDDGYRNNLTIAAPILKKYNLPFAVFLSTDYMDSSDMMATALPRLIIVGGGV